MKRKLIAIFFMLLLAAGCSKAPDTQSSTPDASLAPSAQSVPAQSSVPAVEESRPFGDFTAMDLDGNTIDQTLFAQADLTMVNIWATYCGPCISGMPDMEQLSQDYKEKGVQVVGIVLDVMNNDGSPSAEQETLAREAVDLTGVTYQNLLINPELYTKNVPFAGTTPETFFIDKEGNYVGDNYLGKRDRAFWDTLLEEKLKEVAA